jgi:hypothetical protein
MNKTLTNKDWTEIYYALVSKHRGIQNREYGPTGPDCNTAKWEKHLATIIKKIGPDGENMYEGA